jgi:hypothetical protein
MTIALASNFKNVASRGQAAGTAISPSARAIAHGRAAPRHAVHRVSTDVPEHPIMQADRWNPPPPTRSSRNADPSYPRLRIGSFGCTPSLYDGGHH